MSGSLHASLGRRIAQAARGSESSTLALGGSTDEELSAPLHALNAPAAAESEPPPPRHVRVSGPRLTFRFERCVHQDCAVTASGVGSVCGERACPRCGSGGANLSTVGRGRAGTAVVRCTCGHSWSVERPRRSGMDVAPHALAS